MIKIERKRIKEKDIREREGGESTYFASPRG